MSAMLPTFQFDHDTLRPATLNDFPLAAVWTRADPDHHRVIAPEFWIDGRDTYLLLDEGQPAFFFKTERTFHGAVKLFIQFDPLQTRESRLRNRAALRAGLWWLEKELSERGFPAVYFTSKSPSLMRFCERRLGFTVEGNVLRKDVRRLSDGGGKVDRQSGGQDEGQGHRG